MRFALVCALGVSLLGGAPAAATEGPRFPVERFEIEGELPIPRERALMLLAPFAGPDVDLERLQAAAARLEAELFDRGFAFYRVIVPPQALRGTAVVRVLPFRLAKVDVSGNRNFTTENVLASLPALKLGDSPNVAAVARNRAAANEHPTKRVEVTFRQSEVPDSVEAAVAVQDAPPRSIFFGLNNIGDSRTGRWRTMVGFQHSNLWNLDHSLTATYTTAPEKTQDVQQYGFYYRMPFYSVGGALTVFYAHSDVNSGVVAEAFQVSGRGTFMGLHWRQHLTPIGAYSHSVELGLDDRFFDNDVVFGGTEQIGVDVRSRPASLAYRARYDAAAWALAAGIQYSHNLAGGSDNNDTAYVANRFGAGRRWEAWRYDADAAWRVQPITFVGRLRGQYSNEALIPGEQFGVGGAMSVRGFREREFSGDYGYTLAFEAIVPTPLEGVSVVGFFDHGIARRIDSQPGEAAQQTAASAGIGLRWVLPRRVSLALDVAQVLDSTVRTVRGMRRLHVTLLLQI